MAAKETVFNALYNLLLTASYPFTIVNSGSGRLMAHWDQLGSGAQPALYLQQGAMKFEQNPAPSGSAGLTRKVYLAKAWFFFRREGTVLPATQYNEILDAVEAVLVPGKPVSNQTLASQNNGVPLVTNVKITDANWDEGTLDPQGGQVVVMVGLEILTFN
jgi:hypothetical protein